ncbi:hypothetical protein MSG28_011143 [Choristoneura fumiferana]|uniref:Uncharacterized protein n=1 Tax=Choristoneura fumiferana TaxID=7141 RepID=A0ACC0KQ66_CHOFU|nr:hypothetical protein MSG28_011143 [Choristoneura fumiferana]
MVDNNGHVLYHPDLRPLYTNEEYTETLRPLYSSVDLTDVELLVDSDDNSRINLTSLLLDLRHDMIEQREGETEIGVKVQYGSMRRVATRRQRYFYSPVEGTPYSLAIVLPDGYGMVYCEYASTSEQTFNSPEEQLLHFLTRSGRPGWKWMSVRPRALALHNAHKKQDRDSYFCDKNLVQSLVRDAMVIKELDAHIGHASHHNQQGRFHKFVVTLSFIATRSGLLKWTENNNSSRTGDSSEPHFSEKYSRAYDSEWYRRAVEHHAIEPESFVFSVPFRDGEGEDMGGGRRSCSPPTRCSWSLADTAHRPPSSGCTSSSTRLLDTSLMLRPRYCTAGTVCKKTCAGDALDCYILDDNGFIILSEDASQTGLFFGQVDGTIMDSLVQDRIYKKVTVHDRQGRCPDSRNPFSGDGCKLASAKAHSHPYADDELDYEDYENEELDADEDDRDRGKYEIIIDGFGAEKGPEEGRAPPTGSQGGSAPREPPREAARSAAVRPCDTSAELFTLQSSRLNAAQPLKGKLTNCHNSGCERWEIEILSCGRGERTRPLWALPALLVVLAGAT